MDPKSIKNPLGKPSEKQTNFFINFYRFGLRFYLPRGTQNFSKIRKNITKKVPGASRPRPPPPGAPWKPPRPPSGPPRCSLEGLQSLPRNVFFAGIYSYYCTPCRHYFHRTCLVFCFFTLFLVWGELPATEDYAIILTYVH